MVRCSKTITTGTSFRNGSVPWKRSSTQVQRSRGNRRETPKFWRKQRVFCKHALHFVRESKQSNTWLSITICVHLMNKYVEFAVISLLSHEKSPKIPEISQMFDPPFRCGGWHPLNEWYTLKAAGSRKVGWFFSVGESHGFYHVLHWAPDKNRLLKSLDDCANDWFRTKNDPLSWVMFEEMMC